MSAIMNSVNVPGTAGNLDLGFSETSNTYVTFHNFNVSGIIYLRINGTAAATVNSGFQLPAGKSVAITLDGSSVVNGITSTGGNLRMDYTINTAPEN